MYLLYKMIVIILFLTVPALLKKILSFSFIIEIRHLPKAIVGLTSQLWFYTEKQVVPAAVQQD